VCRCPKSRKINENLNFGVLGRLRSSMLIKLKSPWPVLMISNMSVPICNRFYSRKANNGKITFLWGRVTRFDALVRGEPSYIGAGNFVTKKLETLGQPNVKFLWSCLHRFDTDPKCDGRTNRRTPRPWLRRVKHSAIARKNCGQTVADTGMVAIDSLQEVASALSDGTIADPLRLTV